MRKFNLVVALIDQRPSRIDDEIMSQLGNRMILSLKESKDLDHALSGLPKAAVWSNIVQTIPARTALIVGDAVRVPTVIEIMDYSTIQKHLEKTPSGKKKLTAEDIGKITKNADKIISSID